MYSYSPESGEINLVADINEGTGSSYPQEFTVFKQSLYFIANDGTGNGLWRQSMGGAPTELIGQISGDYLHSLTSHTGNLYLINEIENDSYVVNNTELWVYG